MTLYEDDYEYSRYDFSEMLEELPPLIKTKSQILFCVVNNNVEGLELLISHPDLFQVADKNGFPILQISILKENIAVFDFLLSLDGCPLETRNKKGKTALEVALPDSFSGSDIDNEHFAYSLLKKGAHFDYNSTFLHSALYRNYCKVARFLIENGADLNCYDDDGKAPLHLIDELRSDVDEILAMLLCYGADPWIPDNNDFKPLDWALINEHLSESMKENLIYYLCDDYCTDLDILFDSFYNLLQFESPLLPNLLKCITSINMYEVFNASHQFFVKLFMLKPEYLKLLLEKFDYVIEYIVDEALKVSEFDVLRYHDFFYSNKIFVENFDLMLQSQFGSNVIQIFNKTKIEDLIEQSWVSGVCNDCNEIHSGILFDSVLVMLSYGANIYDRDVEDIYKICGDCEFFRILLHMDIKTSDENQQCDIIPGLIYNIQMDIEIFLNDPNINYRCCRPLEAVANLLNFSAHPKLQKLCSSLSMENDEDINVINVKNLPSVPLLVELARNEVRKFLIQKYKIKNSMQFHTLIKHLPISKVHKKIITFETKLY